MKNFRDIKVWQKAHKLTLNVYKMSNSLPNEEKYGIANKIRRAMVSVPTNIAEGCGRNSDRDFVRFLTITFGSANEVEYLLVLCKDLNFIDLNIFKRLHEDIVEVKKMLSSLINAIRL